MSELLPSPHKLLITYTGIPLWSVQIIQNIIHDDEGGWELETDPSDYDGGWTYGGMTKSLFNEYYPNSSSLENIQSILSGGVGPRTINLREQIVCIYHQEFCAPLLSGVLSADNKLPIQVHVSCAVNDGISIAKQLIAQSLLFTGGGIEMQRRAFLTAWKELYFRDLTNNPDRDVKYIHGWINRVWKYLWT